MDDELNYTETHPLRTDIPLDHHPAALKGGTATSRIARTALADMYAKHASLLDAARDVADKPALAQTATQMTAAVRRGADSALKRLQAQYYHYVGEVDAELTKTNDTAAGEIRGYFRGLGANAVTTALAAITRGDRRTSAAILAAPAYLSGLDADQHELLKDRAAEVFLPEKAASMREAQLGIARVERARDHFMETMTKNIAKWQPKGADALAKLAKENAP